MLDNIKRIIFPKEQYEDDDYDEVYPGDVEEPDFPEPEGNQYDSRKVTDPKNNDFYRAPKSKGEKLVNNVVGLPGITNSNAEVSVITPRSFEEMPEVIHALRERKSVILNLNMMNPEEAQRAVDFVSGGTYAMDGQYERVGESIFLFTPSCVKVSIHSDVIDDLTNSGNSGVRRPTPKHQDYWQEVSAVGQ